MTGPRIAVVGIGNSLRGDDGVGGEVIRALSGRELPKGVDLIDAGSPGLGLLSILEEYDRTVIVDSSFMGEAPGTVRVFRPDQARSLRPSGSISVHDVDPLEILFLASAVDMALEVTVVGIQPGDRKDGQGLSDPVRMAVAGAAEEICLLLARDR